MIFYNGALVDWKNKNCDYPDTDTVSKIRKTITEIKENNFSEDKKGFCQLRYPNGVRVKNKSGLYEPKKKFFLDLVSYDGKWRWSPSMPRNGRFSYKNGNHYKVEDSEWFYEKDLELIWFLQTHCPQVKSGKVYFEDFDKKAGEEIDKMTENIDIQHAIFSGRSPVAKDLKLLRDVADAFEVADVKKLTKNELKMQLYESIVRGEKNNSKYVNLKKFEELTDNNAKMRATQIIRKAIHNDELKFKKADNTWYIHNAGEYIEPMLKIKVTDYQDREHILLDKVLEDNSFKGKIYSELGVGIETRADVEGLDFHVLKKMCGDEEGIAVEKSDRKDDLVKKYCSHFEIKS
jgi:hypothetical protein